MTTPFSLLGPAEFQAGVQGLLPRGRAWPRRLTSLLAAVCGGVGDCYAQFHAGCVNFLDVESDPAQANALLTDWETDFGLPDPCDPANPTLTQRHAALLAKIAAQGGQNEAYYISFAAALGYTITITTWDAWTPWDSSWLGITDTDWRFAWQVNAPTVIYSYFTGWSSPWDPLWTVNDTTLACKLAKIAPAYGIFWIN